jgi:hypothetical protein
LRLLSSGWPPPEKKNQKRKAVGCHSLISGVCVLFRCWVYGSGVEGRSLNATTFVERHPSSFFPAYCSLCFSQCLRWVLDIAFQWAAVCIHFRIYTNTWRLFIIRYDSGLFRLLRSENEGPYVLKVLNLIKEKEVLA